MSLLLPNPCLLGIFLTISTYDGPQLVFHYPPKPNEYGYKATPLAQDRSYLRTTGAMESSSSSSDSDMISDDDEDEETSTQNRGSSRTDSFNTHRSHDTLINENYLSGKALLDILDEQDRKRERKEKRQKKLIKNIMIKNAEDSNLDNDSSLYNSNNTSFAKLNKDTLSHTTSNTNNKLQSITSLNKLFGFEIDLLSELITPPKNLCNTRFEVTIDDMSFLGLPIHVQDDGNWKTSKRARTKTSRNSRNSRRQPSHKSFADDELTHSDDHHDSESDSDHLDTVDKVESRKEDKCPMNMFHLVFAMNPPVVEYNHRIDEMYHYIISRLTLVLRYEQHKSNFVYKEAMKIMNLKDEHRDLSINELWMMLIRESSLLNIIYQTYQSVSNSDIVNVDINGKIRSFQIPIKNEFSTLPPTTVSILRGSYLSSVNPFFNDTAHDDNTTLLHFALILLDDPEAIIDDIQVEKDSIIANFIKMIKPTESLNKLSTISGLDLNQIFSFAFHLVLWRRAIAVPPLQTRNVYIVSPLAPLQNLNSDMELFKLQFQSLPSLPVFLSMLSLHSKPRPYSMLLPSRDHRDLYLDALAWLIKAGYALQLHTFLWLKVTNKIKVAVEEEIEMENFKKRENKNLNHISNDGTNSNSNGTSNRVGNKEDNGDNTDNDLRTDNLVDNRSIASTEDEDNESHTGDVVKKKQRQNRIVVVEEECIILLDPERATALERRWIGKIVEGKPPELITLFYRLLKYFNGKDALELILVKENISRTDIKRLLSSIDDYIVSVKHW